MSFAEQRYRQFYLWLMQCCSLAGFCESLRVQALRSWRISPNEEKVRYSSLRRHMPTADSDTIAAPVVVGTSGRHYGRLLTGTVGILVIVLGLVAIASRITPPLDNPAVSGDLPPQIEEPIFEAVRIHQDGTAIFSGRATPGAKVQLLLNNERLVDVAADIYGEWTHTLGAELPPGQSIVQIVAGLEGFAKSRPDEQLLIDLGAIDPDSDGALPNDQATVFAVGSRLGLRVLQRRVLAQVVAVSDAAPEAPGKRGHELMIESVLFNEDDDEVAVSGFGTPNATIRAILDKSPEGTSTVNAAGHWQVMVSIQDIDQKDPILTLTEEIDGVEQSVRRVHVIMESVLAPKPSRLKSVSEKAAEKTTGSKPQDEAPTTITVRQGDSLWGLAARVYGDGSKFRKIFDDNRDQMRTHKDLRPGMVLKVFQ